MAEKQKYASFDPADMKEGSNLFDNVNLEITKARYSKEAPDNYTAEGNPIFAWVDLFMYEAPAPAAGEDDTRHVNNVYALGASSGDNFTISEDGFGLIPVDADNPTQLRKDSKFGTFTDSLKKEGVPPSILQSGDISALAGLRAHFKRVADKERNFGDQKGRKASKFPPSTLCVTKIHSKFNGSKIVNEGGATTAAPASAPGTPGTAAVAPAGDVDTKAGAYLAQVVKAKGGTVQRGQILLMVSQAAIKEINRQDIAKRATDEAFLNSINEAGGVLDAEGNVITLKYDASAKPQVVKIA